MPRASSLKSTWAVAAALSVLYMLSTIPTPLYALYEKQFGFSPLILTVIFAMYAVGTIATMLFLGRLSDQIGRRPVILIALAVAAVNAFVFLFVRNTAWLLVARILTGVVIALCSGPSAAWIIELEPNHNQETGAQTAVTATFIGLTLGSWLAGVLVQYGPTPLRLVYWIFLALLIPVTLAIIPARETIHQPVSWKKISWKPRFGVPPGVRLRFLAQAIAAFITLAVTGFYTGLIPGLLARVMGRKSNATSGLIVAALYWFSAAAIVALPRWKNRSGLIIALGFLLPGIGILVLAEALRSFPWLLAGTVLTGYATGLSYFYSFQSINEMAPEDQRAEIVSVYLIACYLGYSLPIVGIGLLSNPLTPKVADYLFAGVIAALTLTALTIEIMVPDDKPKKS